MTPLEWFRPPRAVLTLFICLMAVCGLALGWLGWKVLEQDRAVESQRRQERIESAADRAVAATVRAFESADVEVTVAANGAVETKPPERLAYAPAEPAAAPLSPDTFTAGEAFEFGGKERVKAIDAYTRLAGSPNSQVRAEALVRLGRVLRREKKWPEALNAYAVLERMGAIQVADMPAGLVARAARCSVLEESGDRAAAGREAANVWADLTSGKWQVTRETLETYLKELKTWEPRLALPSGWEERMALAEAAAWAYRQPASSGKAGLHIEGQAVSVAWERQGGAWKARLSGPSFWRALWVKLERESGVALRVTAAGGQVIHGNGSGSGQAAFRAAAVTGLPWSVAASLQAGETNPQPWDARRRLMLAGLLVFAVLLASGSFLIARAISRELAVARLQSDFVGAVSHEFRTPLTSIRQLTEMLARGRMTEEDQKQRAYELMLGESDRLTRLVESLLDLGRMQAREYKFRSESLDAAEWARSVAGEFEETVRAKGYVVEFSAPSGEARIRGDREALGGALWNLLDNAVKYSPGEKQVSMEVSSSNGKVEVSVRDRGTGIAKEDLRRIFGKFYRGANAKKQGTKGTGIGLATAKEIVEAHGGTVRAESEPGCGSKFTIVLPCEES